MDQRPRRLSFCADPYAYRRRTSRAVDVGGVPVGGGHPVRVQSMLTSDTRDTGSCVREALALAEAGCEIVRVTAQTRQIAANLESIVGRLRSAGCSVPVVADIHFKPDAAMEAVKWVDKVRVNPGNYADKKKFAVREYSDAEYAEELERIDAEFSPLVQECLRRGVAMRIGTNHGSLSDRIMNRFGDTPLGMVESALEFARIARRHGFHGFIFSMKASNPKVMIEAYRLLVARLAAEGGDWNYPIHLGVTEAGDGEDGRIKSAIGIGSLLMDGIGDTIRVSLTEDAVHEIPVARALVEACCPPAGEAEPRGGEAPFDPFAFARRESGRVTVPGGSGEGGKGGEVALGGGETVAVFTSREKWDALAHKIDRLGDYRPEVVAEGSGFVAVDPRDAAALGEINSRVQAVPVTVADGVDLPVVAAFRLLASGLEPRHPIVLKDTFHPATASQRRDAAATVDASPLGSGVPPGSPPEAASAAAPSDSDFLSSLLRASANLGSLLCDGIGDAVLVQGEAAPGQSLRVAYNVLQAAGVRIFKTDYVACPSCGRTLFDLQSTTQRIRAATGHLKGVRIAVMGCIVNGPGEMADADFGYVGGAPGKINLYVGKTPVKFNIPEGEAVERLVDLIREHERWVEAPPAVEPSGEPEPAGPGVAAGV